MNIAVLLIIILLFVLVGALPVFPHSMSFGYGPSGVIGIILIVVIVLLLTGRL